MTRSPIVRNWRGIGLRKEAGPLRQVPDVPDVLQIAVPFTVAAKKNAYEATTRRIGGGRVIPVLHLRDEFHRVQDAIWIWAVAELLLWRGYIEQDKRDEMRSLALVRLHAGGGVGDGLMDELRDEVLEHGAGTAWSSEVECALACVAVVGRSADDDHLVIRGQKLGVRDDKHRTGRKRDVDGTLSTVLDGLKGAWWQDDRQVAAVAGERCIEADVVNPSARAAAALATHRRRAAR